MQDNALQVVACPHPFKVEQVSVEMLEGLSIEEIVAAVQPDPLLRQHAHVYIDAEPVRPDCWQIVPPAGSFVSIRMVPHGGGGGKNPLATILSIVVIAAAAWAGPAIAGTMFASGTTAFTVASVVSTAVVGIAGSLAVSAIAPPPSQGFAQIDSRRDSALLGINGTRNQSGAGRVIQRLYGTHYQVPYYGPPPYTELVGQDQYLRCLFIVGYGPLQISDIKIGDTLLTEFDDYEIEVRQGYESDQATSLYPSQVSEDAVGALLSQATSWVTRTTDTDIDEFSVDIIFPRGLVEFSDDGSKAERSVTLQAEYSPAGQNNWTGFNLNVGNSTFTAKRTAAVRYGAKVAVSNGQYDVRLRRSTADSSDSKIFDEVYWSVLRSITKDSPVALSGLAQIALRVKATDQLNGVIDQLNCTATSILPAWNGSTWLETATSNPAAIFRDIFQGNAMKEPLADSRLDLAELQEWAEECDAEGYEFNGIFDFATTPFEAARTVAAVGHASFAVKDGLFSVVRDSAAVQARGVKQHITPRNSSDVRGEKSFDEIHGIQVRFINAAEGYRQDDFVVYADGYNAANASRIDKLQLFGVTDRGQAWKKGRRYLAEAILRPEMHSRVMDVEHLVATRGDLVRVTDDIALHGLGSGRIKGLTLDGSDNVIVVELDEQFAMETGKTYGARVRYGDNSEYYFAVDTVDGVSVYLRPSVPIAPANAPEEGDLLMFGYTDQESVLKIIHRIEMLDDLAARVHYVDAAPEIFGYAGSVPSYDPQISIPADSSLNKPYPPEILDVRSDETAAEKKDDGSFGDRIMISVAPGLGGATTATFECHYKLANVADEPWEALPPVSVATGVIYIPDVAKGVEYFVRIRAISPYGVASDWTSFAHTVVGKTGAVPSVINLWVENSTGDNLTFTAQDCHVVWTNQVDLWHDPLWLDHYLVEVLDKDTSAVLHTEKPTEERFSFTLEKNRATAGGPHREFKVRVTAVDIFERESTPMAIQPVNHQAGQVTGVTVDERFGSAEVAWTNLQESALAGYIVRIDGVEHRTVGPQTNSIYIGNLADDTYTVTIGAFDVFGQDDMAWSTGVEMIIDSTVTVTDLADFPGELSDIYSAPILEGDIWSNSAGNLTWNEHSLWFNGIEITIAAGSTSHAYVYWNGPSTTAYSTTDDVSVFQTISEENQDFQIAINYGDSYELGWDSRANMVIGTAKLGIAAAENANIGNIIQSASYSVVPGVSGSGWRLSKAGALIATDIEIYDTDGNLLIDGNTAAVAASSIGGDPASKIVRENNKITSANASTFIDDLALNTLQLAGNSVSVPTYAEWSVGNQTSLTSGTWYTLYQSPSVNFYEQPQVVWSAAGCQFRDYDAEGLDSAQWELEMHTFVPPSGSHSFLLRAKGVLAANWFTGTLELSYGGVVIKTDSCSTPYDSYDSPGDEYYTRLAGKLVSMGVKK